MAKNTDPFLGLKNIAYLRSGLDSKSSEKQVILDFAKHKLCAARNKLFLDPIWDRYSPEDLLIEFFTLCFDENEEFKEEFKKALNGGKSDDIKWFEKKRKEWEKSQLEKKAKEIAGGKDEFEETFSK